MLFWSGVSGTLLLLAASPVVSLVLGGSTGLWVTWFILLLVVLWFYKPFVVEGVVIITANLIMGVAAPIVWNKLEPHQQNRLLTFLDPARDPKASGYQVAQSRIAIGSGGWTGKDSRRKPEATGVPSRTAHGLHLRRRWRRAGLPWRRHCAHALLFLFLRVIRVATRASDSFSSLVAFGLAGSWFVHVIVNVGMTINLMPITGIPLPFFSYGGSFLLACWIAVGMLVRISAEGRGRAAELPLG
jgi:rod shape determining protein RodA